MIKLVAYDSSAKTYPRNKSFIIAEFKWGFNYQIIRKIIYGHASIAEDAYGGVLLWLK